MLRAVRNIPLLYINSSAAMLNKCLNKIKVIYMAGDSVYVVPCCAVSATCNTASSETSVIFIPDKSRKVSLLIGV